MAASQSPLPPFTLHYFGVKNAAATTTMVLEQKGVAYEAKNYGLDFEAWGKVKPTTPTGTLPLMEFPGGEMVAESGACLRVAGKAAGMLGEGLDYARSEMLMGLCADLWKIVYGAHPTIMSKDSFKADSEEGPAKLKAWEEAKDKAKTKLESFEKVLVGGSGDKFSESGETVGEFELFFKLYQLKHGAWSSVLEDVPSLKPFFERVAALEGPTKFLSGKSKFGELIDYFVPLP